MSSVDKEEKVAVPTKVDIETQSYLSQVLIDNCEKIFEQPRHVVLGALSGAGLDNVGTLTKKQVREAIKNHLSQKDRGHIVKEA